MLISTVTGNTCSLEVTIPAGSDSYDATRVEVEITGSVGATVETFVYTLTGNITIVQATSVADGTITILGIPLYESSGNSIKVKYFSADLVTYEVISTTGTFVRRYA